MCYVGGFGHVPKARRAEAVLKSNRHYSTQRIRREVGGCSGARPAGGKVSVGRQVGTERSWSQKNKKHTCETGHTEKTHTH